MEEAADVELILDHCDEWLRVGSAATVDAREISPSKRWVRICQSKTLSQAEVELISRSQPLRCQSNYHLSYGTKHDKRWHWQPLNWQSRTFWRIVFLFVNHRTHESWHNAKMTPRKPFTSCSAIKLSFSEIRLRQVVSSSLRWWCIFSSVTQCTHIIKIQFSCHLTNIEPEELLSGRKEPEPSTSLRKAYVLNLQL